MNIERIKKGQHHDETRLGNLMVNELCDDNYEFKRNLILKWELIEDSSNLKGASEE